MRLLLILIVVALVIYIVKSALKRPAKRSADGSRKGESMVSCSQCRLHIPRSEAVVDGERFFCGETHLQQWRDARPDGRH